MSEQIVHEYRGLNLSHPPRLTWVSSLQEALERLEGGRFDLVITIAPTVDQRVFDIGDAIKDRTSGMPVVVLTHQEALPEVLLPYIRTSSSIDHIFFWSGNAEILLAIIKCVEDRLNVRHDTDCAGIRVILVVEDSPFYLSVLMPILYRELVIETQLVIEDGLNEEHRLLSMRARPKILGAHSYEQALALYQQFEPFVLGVVSDVRFSCNEVLDGQAGVKLLKHIKSDRFDIPLLMVSTEPCNAELAKKIPAVFIDKNSATLHDQIRSFLLDYLGFGDFVFKTPDGREISRATDLYALEQALGDIPDESFAFHCRRNDFSRWLFSLAEVELASQVRPLRNADFDSIDQHRAHLVRMIREQRMQRQKGVVVNFDADRFDPDTEFLKIGKGSLGGKARGLAFMSAVLHKELGLHGSFEAVDIIAPQTLVITTDGFDEFMAENGLEAIVKSDLSDEEIGRKFTNATFPPDLRSQLRSYLNKTRYPLAVRSSSLLEDAQFKAYAGLYSTYMLPNDHQDLEKRLEQLIGAVKLIYASTYFAAPRSFSHRVGNRTENEKMAVIIQRAVGSRYGDFFYPAISGVAQSSNYYPFGRMRLEDGIASIALGLGKAVMEGEKSLRFSPRHPGILPQRSTVTDILQNSQKQFYALKMDATTVPLGADDAATIAKRDVTEAVGEHPVNVLASTFERAENRIRDTFSPGGYPVITFAAMLKYETFPLSKILEGLLDLGRERLGCPVEIEFAVDLPDDSRRRAQFAVLQIRPMSAREEMLEVNIPQEDLAAAVCVSHQALGNIVKSDMTHIVYVKPDTFDAAKTTDIATEIAQVNGELFKAEKKYLLIGPGRWGSADHWLGIPVKWEDICGVDAIIEATHPAIHAEPSQGSHFFHNITTLGINYLDVGHEPDDQLDWEWILSLPVSKQTTYIAHATLPAPVTLKVDGRQRLGVILKPISNHLRQQEVLSGT